MTTQELSDISSKYRFKDQIVSQIADELYHVQMMYDKCIEILEDKKSPTGRPISNEQYSYSSKQRTKCAVCGETKHTPLRRDEMGGYVCLTCIDKKLDASQVSDKRAEELRAENNRLTKRVADLEKELATPILVNTARLADQLATEREKADTLRAALEQARFGLNMVLDPEQDNDLSYAHAYASLEEADEALAATEPKP